MWYTSLDPQATAIIAVEHVSILSASRPKYDLPVSLC